MFVKDGRTLSPLSTGPFEFEAQMSVSALEKKIFSCFGSFPSMPSVKDMFVAAENAEGSVVEVTRLDSLDGQTVYVFAKAWWDGLGLARRGKTFEERRQTLHSEEFDPQQNGVLDGCGDNVRQRLEQRVSFFALCKEEGVDDNGDCQFDAAARQIVQKTGFKQESKELVRAKAVKWLKDNPKFDSGHGMPIKDWIESMPEHKKSYGKYLVKMSKAKAWGDETTLWAICHAYKVNIVLILSSEGGKWHTYFETSRGGPVLWLGHELETHYWSLVDVPSGVKPWSLVSVSWEYFKDANFQHARKECLVQGPIGQKVSVVTVIEGEGAYEQENFDDVPLQYVSQNDMMAEKERLCHVGEKVEVFFEMAWWDAVVIKDNNKDITKVKVKYEFDNSEKIVRTMFVRSVSSVAQEPPRKTRKPVAPQEWEKLADEIIQKLWPAFQQMYNTSERKDKAKKVSERITGRQVTVQDDFTVLETFQFEGTAGDVASDQIDFSAQQFKDFYEEEVRKVMKDIYSMIGLQQIKEFVTRVLNQYRAAAKLGKSDKVAASLKFELAFLGNPGTGKTTVAKLLPKLYWLMGLLRYGHCVEIVGSDLEGQYVGEATPRTQEFLKKTKGGCLFLDEAYSLVSGEGSSGDSYGKKALAALMKDTPSKERLLILAGYGQSMQVFFGANQGASSRFEMIDFPNYSPVELKEIALGLALNSDVLSFEGCEGYLLQKFQRCIHLFDGDSGNGRAVKTLFDKVRESVERNCNSRQKEGGKFVVAKEDIDYGFADLDKIGSQDMLRFVQDYVETRMNGVVETHYGRELPFFALFAWEFMENDEPFFNRETALTWLLATKCPCVLSGPSGCGKSTFCKYLVFSKHAPLYKGRRGGALDRFEVVIHVELVDLVSRWHETDTRVTLEGILNAYFEDGADSFAKVLNQRSNSVLWLWDGVEEALLSARPRSYLSEFLACLRELRAPSFSKHYLVTSSSSADSLKKSLQFRPVVPREYMEQFFGDTCFEDEFLWFACGKAAQETFFTPVLCEILSHEARPSLYDVVSACIRSLWEKGKLTDDELDQLKQLAVSELLRNATNLKVPLATIQKLAAVVPFVEIHDRVSLAWKGWYSMFCIGIDALEPKDIKTLFLCLRERDESERSFAVSELSKKTWFADCVWERVSDVSCNPFAVYSALFKKIRASFTTRAKSCNNPKEARFLIDVFAFGLRDRKIFCDLVERFGVEVKNTWVHRLLQQAKRGKNVEFEIRRYPFESLLHVLEKTGDSSGPTLGMIVALYGKKQFVDELIRDDRCKVLDIADGLQKRVRSRYGMIIFMHLIRNYKLSDWKYISSWLLRRVCVFEFDRQLLWVRFALKTFSLLQGNSLRRELAGGTLLDDMICTLKGAMAPEEDPSPSLVSLSLLSDTDAELDSAKLLTLTLSGLPESLVSDWKGMFLHNE